MKNSQSKGLTITSYAVTLTTDQHTYTVSTRNVTAVPLPYPNEVHTILASVSLQKSGQMVLHDPAI